MIKKSKSQVFYYEWMLAWRFVRSSKFHQKNHFISFISWFSLIGIALGVMALIVVLSVMNGFQQEVRNKMLAVVSHIEVYPTSDAVDARSVMQKIMAIEGVKGVAPFVSGQALLVRGDEVKGILVRGIIPEYEIQVSDLLNGLPIIQRENWKPGEFSVLVGLEIAKKWELTKGDSFSLVVPSGNSTPVGILPRFKNVRVYDFFDTGHFDFNNNLLLLHYEDALKVFRTTAVSGYRVKIDDYLKTPQIGRKIEHALGEGFLIRDWTTQNRHWFEAVVIEKRMMFIILTLIVAVAAFNLVSILVMTVTDKKSVIAVMRTLGASPRSIMFIFMLQGCILGFLGSLLGATTGLLVAYHLPDILKFLENLFSFHFLPETVYLITFIPSQPLWSDFMPIILITWLLSLIATLYPSWQASRLNPVDILRHE
ncbi:MAG: lipoprotein-releasing ABC transporter permease subunit [Gammaproteobacteria bacterium]|nr:lipoprotein-releasing ABC transporter permease subunit [Gammaproteobacteria bacterium]